MPGAVVLGPGEPQPTLSNLPSPAPALLRPSALLTARPTGGLGRDRLTCRSSCE